MPVTLPEVIFNDGIVKIRGVDVPVRGFDFTEIGPLIATYPGMSQALTGNLAAVLIDKRLMDHALATCVGLEPETKLKQDEKKDLLKEIFRLTWEDAIGPFVELAASLGGSAAILADEIGNAILNKSSSPPSADSDAPGTSETKS